MRISGVSTPSNRLFGVQQVLPLVIVTLFRTNTNLGCEKLAAIEESIVTAFSEIGGDGNNTLVVTLNRAYRVRALPLCDRVFIDQ
jgi:hypothetical protein